jgi:hypothetical protein
MMLDYQRIVDDVRSALFNNGQDGRDFLQGVAADYALTIDEANERLRQCGVLLRKGLRSEAIQLCEIEPNLLDVVAILDFPERDVWNNMLSLYGLSLPPVLMLDVAANLNEAYAAERPLARLLQRHRLLAMAHGPLKLRLDTLRSLADADPENPIWEQDVQTFEEERVKELQYEVQQAIASGDTTAVNTLADELDSSAWRIERPESLVTQIAAARSYAAQAKGKAELQWTAHQLQAMSAMSDVEGARRARAQWEQLLAAWSQFADPKLLQSVAAPLDWLREQDEMAEEAEQHVAAVAALQRALAASRPADVLERLHREAAEYGDIPQDMEERFHKQVDSATRAARRRTYAVRALIAVSVVAICVVFGVVVFQQLQTRKVDRARASLEQLLKDDKLDEARNFLDQLMAASPKTAAAPVIQEIKISLTGRQDEENRRRRALATAMELLQKSIADQFPDKDGLARAKKLAKTEEEKAAIGIAEQEIDMLEHAIKSKVDQDFVVQLKDFKERIDAVEKEMGDQPEAAIQKLKNLKREIGNLRTLNSQISETSARAAERLQIRTNTLFDAAQTIGDRRKHEEAITAVCGDRAAFAQKLVEYADAFPQDRRSDSFHALARDESALWDWIDQWNGTVQTVGRGNWAKFDRKAAALWTVKLQKLLEDSWIGHPNAEAFKQRLPYLAAIAQRTDSEGNPIEAALKPIFTDPLVTGVWMLKDTAGKRYYFHEDLTAKLGLSGSSRPEGAYGFEYLTGLDLHKRHGVVRGSDIETTFALAPQRATARALAAALGDIRDDRWDASFCGMIDTVLDDHQTDPLLKHIFLRKIVAVGCQGSLCLQRALGDSFELLKNSKVPLRINWIDPNDAEALQQRPIAEAELAKISNVIDVRNAAVRQWQSLEKPVGVELLCIGWLRKDEAGNWQCVAKPSGPQSGKLVVATAAVAKGSNGKTATFSAVGRMERGKAILDIARGPALAEGRPVYVVTLP